MNESPRPNQILKTIILTDELYDTSLIQYSKSSHNSDVLTTLWVTILNILKVFLSLLFSPNIFEYVQ